MICRGLFICGLKWQPHCLFPDANISNLKHSLVLWCRKHCGYLKCRAAQLESQQLSLPSYTSLCREQHHGTTGSPAPHPQNLFATATILGTSSKAHSLTFLFETGPQRLNLQSKFAVMGFQIPPSCAWQKVPLWAALVHLSRSWPLFSWTASQFWNVSCDKCFREGYRANE